MSLLFWIPLEPTFMRCSLHLLPSSSLETIILEEEKVEVTLREHEVGVHLVVASEILILDSDSAWLGGP